MCCRCVLRPGGTGRDIAGTGHVPFVPAPGQRDKRGLPLKGETPWHVPPVPSRCALAMADWPYSTAAWQRLRKAKLADKPLCEPCERRGKIVPANTVDHRVSVTSGGEPFPPLDGLMSMCPSCHATKTNALDNPSAFGKRRGFAFKGCDLNGLPIDDAHPFLGGDTPSKDEGERGIGPAGEVSAELIRFRSL